MNNKNVLQSRKFRAFVKGEPQHLADMKKDHKYCFHPRCSILESNACCSCSIVFIEMSCIIPLKSTEMIEVSNKMTPPCHYAQLFKSEYESEELNEILKRYLEE